MIPTTLAVLVVVPHKGRFLLVEECDGTFYLPAGKVEPGENLMAAAVRETAEEAGLAIGLRGVLGVDHTWLDGRAKLRFVFVGYLGILTPPKSHADHHSRGARWVNKSELHALPLRHREVVTWIERSESGSPLLPCKSYDWYGSAHANAWSARLG
jgi:8-oxo-dGTP pyrophosphatase MutT (NUDIX family)